MTTRPSARPSTKATRACPASSIFCNLRRSTQCSPTCEPFPRPRARPRPLREKATWIDTFNGIRDTGQHTDRKDKFMSKLRSTLLAGVAILCVVMFAVAIMASATQAADQVLSGVISSAAGQKLDGVTVSAKMEGSTITTSVYTDEKGAYYFPAMPEGKYRLWAQTLGFETAKGSVDLSAAKRQDFTLQPITDAERRYRQLPSELVTAALPESTPQDALMKKIFMNNCNSCHPPGYALQFRF